jgi:hypothetical protein
MMYTIDQKSALLCRVIIKFLKLFTGVPSVYQSKASSLPENIQRHPLRFITVYRSKTLPISCKVHSCQKCFMVLIILVWH